MKMTPERKAAIKQSISHTNYVVKCVRNGSMTIETAHRATGLSYGYLQSCRLGYRRKRASGTFKVTQLTLKKGQWQEKEIPFRFKLASEK